MKELLSNYRITAINKIIPVKSYGFSQDKKLRIFTNNSTYFIREYTNKSQEDIENQAKLLDFLYDRNFPVPLIQRTKNGYSSVTTNNGVLTLYQDIQGNNPDSPNSLTNDQLTKAAEMLAKYHLLVQNYENINPKEIKLHLEPNEIIKIINYVNQLLKSKTDLNYSDKHLMNVLFEKKEELTKLSNNIVNKNISLLPKLQIHGDYHGANLTFDNFNNVIGVFDWEDSAWWMRSAEVQASICMMTKTSTVDHFNSSINLKRAKLFLDTYEKYYPLDYNEKELMPSIAQIDSLRLDFMLKERFINNRKEAEQLFPDSNKEWFWWKFNADKYASKVLNL